MAWTEDPLTTPSDGFELCYECDGKKLCEEAVCPYCRGWCHVCGGAGEWPLDPKQAYFSPAPPTINLVYVAAQRAKNPT